MWRILSSQVWILDYGLYFNSMHDNWVWEDLRFALTMEKNVAQLTPIITFVNDIYKWAKVKGLCDQDFSTIIEVYLLDLKGLNHWKKLCAIILIASHGCINVLAMGHRHFNTRNPDFFDWEFWSIKPPIWFFCPRVQLDQNAILDKLIWTWPF